MVLHAVHYTINFIRATSLERPSLPKLYLFYLDLAISRAHGGGAGVYSVATNFAIGNKVVRWLLFSLQFSCSFLCVRLTGYCKFLIGVVKVEMEHVNVGRLKKLVCLGKNNSVL